MAAVSITQPAELKTSRSGRLLIPRLRNWTGERVFVKKTGFVQIFEGSPDCTVTFVPERKLFQAFPSPGLSQSLNFSRAKISPKKVVKRKVNESLPPTLGSWDTDGKGERQRKCNINLKGSQEKKKVLHSTSTTNNSALLKFQPKIKKITNGSPAGKAECPRKSRSLTRTGSSSRSPCFGKRELSLPANRCRLKTPVKPPSPRINYNTSSVKSATRGALAQCPSPTRTRRQVDVSSRKSPREKSILTVPTRFSPRKTPLREKIPIVNEGLSFKNPLSFQRLEREAKRNSKRPKNSNRVCNEGETEPGFDIFGPQFQPVVRLVRLLPEEILRLTGPAHVAEVKRISEDDPRLSRSPSRKRKSPASPQKKSSTTKKSPQVIHVFPRRKAIRTVRDTQKILEALKKPTGSNEVEDDVTSTGAFFKNSRVNVFKNIHEVDDILNDNFDESDDNLSFRSAYERESSPMPSVPVSPISSFHETDAENSGWEDGLLGESPISAKPTSFQKAQLLYRTLKSQEAAARKLKKLRKEAGEGPSTAVFPPITKAPTNPTPCPLLQPKGIRALEKNLKKKAIRGEKFSYETQYNGNTLHISLNSSDSETSEDSLDSDME